MLLDVWDLSIASYSEKNTVFREVGLFPSSDETVRSIHSLGPLERVKLNHWIFQGYYFHEVYHHYLASQRSV
jgi:hypothetical protein